MFFGCVLSIALLSSACGDGNRIDQIDSSIPAPQPVEVVGVRSIPGGAVIKIRIPDDKNLKGVVAEFTRNNQPVNAKVSRYVDSLVVEGYADTLEHVVKVASFNVNEVQGTPVEVTIQPLPPAIQTVQYTMQETFGGLKIHIMNNVDRADLAVVVLADKDIADQDLPNDQRKWVEVTTLFTAAQDIFLSRRNMPAEETLFGIYLRDHWGNMSEVQTAVLTPWEETQADKSKFRYFDPGDDNAESTNASYYPIQGLWDGSGLSSTGHFFASEGKYIPSWITIDLGVKIKLSRIAHLPRQGYLPFSAGNIRIFEFWGSLDPTGTTVAGNPHGFDNTWVLLGRYEQPKPSGYAPDGSVGEVTSDDVEYYNYNTEFEMDNTGEFPHANDPIRYLRLVCVNTFASYETHATTGQWQTGEITPYGQILETYR